jgi:simple sugar transport system permease protein
LRKRQSKIIPLFVIMVLVIAVISILLPDKFLTLINFQSAASTIPEFGLFAIAMTIAIITGGIDLSIVSIANLCGVIMALIFKRIPAVDGTLLTGGTIMVIAIAAGLSLSALCGTLNGLLVSRFGIPPILATLGTQGLFLGTAVVITKGHGIDGFPESFQFIGNGKLGIIPMPLIIFIVCTLLIALFLSKTRLGMSMYMLGSNPIASRFSGIDNERVSISTYVATGLIAGIAAIIMISRVNSIRPGYGYAYLLQAILVAMLAGVDPAGGHGKIIGVIMAILILQTLQSGFNILALSPFFRKFIWGLMLLLVMITNYLIAEYRSRHRVRARVQT